MRIFNRYKLPLFVRDTRRGDGRPLHPNDIPIALDAIEQFYASLRKFYASLRNTDEGHT